MRLTTLLLVAALPAAAQTFVPGPGGLISTVTDPGPVILADVNNDGKIDAVTGNLNGTISVLLGNGSGGFTLAAGSPIAVAGAGAAIQLSTLDFNRDGKLDLYISYTGVVGIFLGNGAGQFDVDLGGGLTAGGEQVSADFDKDNIPDLVMLNTAANAVSMLRGDTTGGPTLSVPSPTSITAADFNGDGRPDLAVGNSSGGSGAVRVFLTTGSVTFGSPTVINLASGVSFVRAGDLNRDGRPDLIVALTSGSVNTLLQNAQGGFDAVSNSAVSTGVVTGIALADLDNDLRLDVAVASQAQGQVRVLRGNGDGRFTEMANSPFATPGARQLAIADLNGDARPDVVYVDFPSRGVRVLMNNMPRFFPVPRQFDFWGSLGAAVTSSIPVSVFGDGFFSDTFEKPWLKLSANQCCFIVDAAALPAGTHQSAYRPFSAGTFGDSANATLRIAAPAAALAQAAGSPFATGGTGTRGVTTGDFNGDGKPDVAVTNSSSSSVAVLLSNGSGGFTTASGSPFTVGNGPEAAVAGDFNLDGRLDLAVANTLANSLSVLLGNGAGGFTPLPGATFPTGSFPAAIAAADFNGDSFPDLATANNAGGTVTVLLGNGAGGFAAAPGSPVASGGSLLKHLVAADFNGDGKIDLATANSSGSVSILLGNGLGGFAAASGSPIATTGGPFGLAVGDLNADGKQDLAVARVSAGEVSILLGAGDGTFTAGAGSPHAVRTSPQWLAIADFNGDGKPDVASSGQTGGLTFLLGNGAGGFTAAPDNFGASSSAGIAAADFNGDGRTDLAQAAFSANVTVWLGAKADTATSLQATPTSPAFGAAVTLRATVGGAAGLKLLDERPTGTVEFYDGATLRGTGTLAHNNSGEQATLTLSTLAPGAHSVLTAKYLGDVRFNTSTSGAASTVTVGQGSVSVIAIGGTSKKVGGQVDGGFYTFRATLGTAVAGFSVTFTAPTTGASCTFTASATVTTDALGQATSPNCFANTKTGTFAATASVAGVSGNSPTLTNTPGPAETLQLVSGTPQSAVAGTAFSAALVVKVLDLYGNVGAFNGNVTFRAPTSGASGLFTGSAQAAVTAGADGLASSPTFTANGTAGTYTVTATAPSETRGETSVSFQLTNLPAGTLTPPTITTPANGASLGSTVVTFGWTAVTGATKYELKLIEANTPQQFRVELLGNGATGAVYTIPSGNYRMEVKACNDTTCGVAAVSNFVLAGGTVPSAPVTGLGCSVANSSGQNQLTCSWTALANAHFYFINVVQPGAGPGGGALTVAGRQVGGTTVTMLIPNGSMVVLVRGCTADGCGPFSAGSNVSAAIGNPAVPILGEPFAGSSVDSGSEAPRVTFSWNRVPGDNGSNFDYRLYVQDFSRNRAALNVITAANFYSAFFKPGTRYDALVIAIPRGGGAAIQGPANAFLTRGRAPKSPVVTDPAFGDSTSVGSVRVNWTPAINPDGSLATVRYQYFFNGPQQRGGTTTDNFVDLTLPAGAWQGVLRTCTTGTTCTESSDNGWGPWNNVAGSEGGQASFTVR